jgi:Tfp pilus assembly protein PilN
MGNPFSPAGPAHNSFLPEDYIRARAESRANIITLTLFAIVLSSVMGAFVVTKQSVEQVAKRKEFVNQQFQEAGRRIEQLKALEGQQAQMMEKAEITAALVEKVPRWAVLAELTFRMPTDMRLDSLVIKSTRPKVEAPVPTAASKPPAVKSIAGKVAGAIKGGEPKEPERPKPQVPRFTYALTLEGTAVRNQDIADYLASLKESPALDKVEMAFIREAKENDRELRKFQITANVKTNLDTSVLADSLKRLVGARTRQIAEAGKDSAGGKE